MTRTPNSKNHKNKTNGFKNVSWINFLVFRINGDVYTGDWRDGVPHGYGEFIYGPHKEKTSDF